ncbi:MAG: hypothetical protein JST65_12880 [Acidobacteria bacterium]|nr:hypothetical protein [Acidobacteriota bacterium]
MATRRFLLAQMAAAAVVVGILAFGTLFGTFVRWDDEGYFLLSFQRFLQGQPAYDAVYSVYGPYTFLTAGLVTGFQASLATHDYFRWVSLVLWLAIAAVLGWTVFRWTGSRLAGVAGLALVGQSLTGLARSVSHPQVWCLLAVAALVCAGTRWLFDDRVSRVAGWIGFLTAVLLLIKINIGGYVLLGIALFLAVTIPAASRLGRMVQFLAGTAAFVLPAGMMFRQTAQQPPAVYFFLFVYCCSLAAVVAVALRHRTSVPKPWVPAMWFCAGGTLAALIGIGGVLLAGTTLRALFQGVIVEAVLMSNAFFYPYREATQNASLVFFGFAVVCAVCAYATRFAVILKIVAGLGIISAGMTSKYLALCGALALLWMLVWRLPASGDKSAFTNRLWLAILSITHSLILYPISGEKVEWAALFPMVGGLVLVSDGAQEAVANRFVRLVPCVLTTVMMVTLTFAAVRSIRIWQKQPPLGLPGARMLHLPVEDAERLRAGTEMLRRSNCGSAVFVPGMYSLAIWSGVGPLERRKINSWPFLEGPETARREIELQPPGTCVLASDWVYPFLGSLAKVRPPKDAFAVMTRGLSPVDRQGDLHLFRK